jgi:hypothetical protein
VREMILNDKKLIIESEFRREIVSFMFFVYVFNLKNKKNCFLDM